MAVFRRIRDLLGGGETQWLIDYAALPDWISAEEAKAADALGTAVRTPRTSIEASIEHLRGIVDDLAAGEVDETLHARLEKIVRTSVPLFAKSMQTSLARPLPDDPEGFYASIAELLKGCLAAMRGPGRYLRAAFPDEMKEIRTTMDAIGRETNAITQSMALFRRENAAIGAVKSAFEALDRARTERESACSRIRSAEADAAAARIRLDETEEALRQLESDADHQEARARERQLADLEEEGIGIDREYRVLAGSAAHVFKKAGNIASRKGDAAAGKLFAEAIRVLEWFPQSDEEEVIRVLAAAVPEAFTIIDNGLLELKNKEERFLFADPDTPSREIAGTIRRFRAWDIRAGEMRRIVSEAPALAAARDLDARRNALSGELEQHIHARNAAADLLERTESSIPDLETALCQALARRMARAVVIEIDTRRLECPPP